MHSDVFIGDTSRARDDERCVNRRYVCKQTVYLACRRAIELSIRGDVDLCDKVCWVGIPHDLTESSPHYFPTLLQECTVCTVSALVSTLTPHDACVAI